MESKRNVGDSTSATFQSPVNTGKTFPHLRYVFNLLSYAGFKRSILIFLSDGNYSNRRYYSVKYSGGSKYARFDTERWDLKMKSCRLLKTVCCRNICIQSEHVGITFSSAFTALSPLKARGMKGCPD